MCNKIVDRIKLYPLVHPFDVIRLEIEVLSSIVIVNCPSHSDTCGEKLKFNQIFVHFDLRQFFVYSNGPEKLLINNNRVHFILLHSMPMQIDKVLNILIQ